jgi:hypothetical protein
MSLLKRFPITSARIAANRRNTRKSTGPRTARGKSQSRMNRLRTGGRSRFYLGLMQALLQARPCSVEPTARAILTPEQAAHPMCAELVEMCRQVEIELVWEHRYRRLHAQDTREGLRANEEHREKLFLYERTHQVYENKENSDTMPDDLQGILSQFAGIYQKSPAFLSQFTR